MAIKTSVTDPIRVDWLPLRLPGRAGLTFAPGKHDMSKHGGGRWARDLGADLDALVGEHCVSTLVCLLQDHEFELLGIAPYAEEARRRGLEVLRLPIADVGVPSLMEAVEGLVETIRQRMRDGLNVAIHCRGGLGRAGTVGGCLLAAEGLGAAEALTILARVRGANCPETQAQRVFVERFAACVASRSEKPSAARSRVSSVVGAVLGAAIGDAMGHPTEFVRSFAELRRRFGPQGVTGYALHWNVGGRRVAPYTDDTQMSEVVLRSLVESRARGEAIDRGMNRLARGFVDWSRNPQGGHRAPGNACLAGCAALARGVPWSEAGGEAAGGCGSVMRVHPVGLVFADDPRVAEEWAVAQSTLTHRDPIALAASAAMAVGVAALVRGEPLQLAFERMIAAAARHDEKTASLMQGALDEARRGIGVEVVLQRLQGWAAHECIAAALYVVARHPDDARAAILEAANTPGDSDSIASLVGALLGAHLGVEALPPEWIAELERAAELRALAESTCR